MRYPMDVADKSSNRKTNRRHLKDWSHCFTMPATALRQVFLAILCLLADGLLPAVAANVPHVDTLPSAPTPSVASLSDLHPAVVHSDRVTIPRLDSEPRLTDFLTSSERAQAPKQ